jgi:nucleotide-binding universal stress UspA family protein
MTSTTPPPAPVVVGVDDLRDCRAALSFAAVEADLSGSTLRLVHVSDDEAASDGRRRPVAFESAETYVREATEGRVKLETAVRPGPVASTLVELSRTASLLVVEHRRLTRVRRQRLTSVACQLAGQARSRVVSVPEDWPASPSESRDRIVVGLDAVVAEADQLLHRAFERALRDGVRLVLVHAWTMASSYDDALVEANVEEEWSATYRRRVRQRLDALGLGDPQVEMEISVIHQEASRALVELSDGADLLLLGRGRTVRPLVHGLGSVPRAVLEDSRCPVEVVASLPE